jgi:3',5'-cyclic-nucleotide phosphodiesterase
MMVDRLDCSGVYIDDRVRSERWVRRTSIDTSSTVSSVGSITLPEEPEALQTDVDQLLGVCKKIYLCQSGAAFATKLAELSDRAGNDCTPIFAFFGIDFSNDESNIARRKASRASWTDIGPPSPSSIQRTFTFSSHSDEAPGLSLLSGVSTDIQVQDGPKLVIPIAILRAAGSDAPEPTSEPQSKNPVTLEHKQIARCLDAGALDVLMTPLDRSRIQGLVVHAYRTHKSALREMSRFLAHKKNRKLSWVGVHDEQPYAYLREAMVSKLMKGICNPEESIDEFQERYVSFFPLELGFEHSFHFL